MDSVPTRTLTDKEFAEFQGMTHSEYRRRDMKMNELTHKGKKMKTFKELMMDINEKLSPDQKKKKDAFLKKNQGGRIHGDDSYHSTNRGRKTRDQRGDNDNTKGSDGSKMDDIDKAAKNNSKDDLKRKMKNASSKGDQKKARKYNRALRMKKSGREGTSGRHGAGDAAQA